MNLVEYTEFLVKNICSKPDMVKVSMFELDDNVTMLEVIVHDDDKGTVIGRKGSMINALRTIIRTKSYVDNIKNVKINIDSF